VTRVARTGTTGAVYTSGGAVPVRPGGGLHRIVSWARGTIKSFPLPVSCPIELLPMEYAACTSGRAPRLASKTDLCAAQPSLPTPCPLLNQEGTHRQAGLVSAPLLGQEGVRGSWALAVWLRGPDEGSRLASMHLRSPRSRVTPHAVPHPRRYRSRPPAVCRRITRFSGIAGATLFE
jgi:hypothetical protein